MHTSVEHRARPRSKPNRIRVRDRVKLVGTLTRTGEGKYGPTATVDVAGYKLTLAAHWIPDLDRLEEGDEVELAGCVTRIGKGAPPEWTPISVAVDGYKLARVTVYPKNVRQE